MRIVLWLSFPIIIGVISMSAAYVIKPKVNANFKLFAARRIKRTVSLDQMSLPDYIAKKSTLATTSAFENMYKELRNASEIVTDSQKSEIRRMQYTVIVAAAGVCVVGIVMTIVLLFRGR